MKSELGIPGLYSTAFYLFYKLFIKGRRLFRDELAGTFRYATAMSLCPFPFLRLWLRGAYKCVCGVSVCVKE